MYVELIRKDDEESFIQVLQFRVVAERVFDSPLHMLPDLMKLLVQKSLGCYAIHFVANPYGRFDVEISSEYPQVKDELLSLNLRKKVGRLYRLFYEIPEAGLERLDYDDFVQKLLSYKPRYSSLDDAALFGYPVHWYGLLETYQFLHLDDVAEEEFYHHVLKTTDERWVSPAMNHKPCPFDRQTFLQIK